MYLLPLCALRGTDFPPEAEPGDAAFPVSDLSAAAASPVYAGATATYTGARRVRGAAPAATEISDGRARPCVSDHGRGEGKGAESKFG